MQHDISLHGFKRICMDLCRLLSPQMLRVFWWWWQVRAPNVPNTIINCSKHWPGPSTEMCRGFCCISFGGFCRGFSCSGHFLPQERGEQIRKKILRPKNRICEKSVLPKTDPKKQVVLRNFRSGLTMIGDHNMYESKEH